MPLRSQHNDSLTIYERGQETHCMNGDNAIHADKTGARAGALYFWAMGLVNSRSAQLIICGAA